MKKAGKNLRGEALAARAAELRVALDEYRGADGRLMEEALQRRVGDLERYASSFRFDLVLAVCVLAFVFCGIATWAVMHWIERA